MEARIAHDGALTYLFRAYLLGNAGGLARFNKCARIFHRCLLQNPMPKVQYVSDAAGTFDRLTGRLPYASFRTEQHTGIDVALQCDARTNYLADRGEIHAPIHAQNSCT